MSNNNLLPLRDFFRNPQKSNFQLSPNGEFISYTEPYAMRMNIFLRTVSEDANPKQITFIEDRDITQYFWKGNDHILYVKDNGGDENFHLYSVQISNMQKTDLTPFPETTVIIIDDLPDDPYKIIIGTNQRNKEIFDPYLVDVRDGKVELLIENPGNITSWLTDHKGEIRIAITTDGVNSTLLYRADNKSEFVEILTTTYKETLSPLFFTFDNKNLYAISNINRDKTAAVIIDPSTGAELEMIYQNEKYDTGGIGYSHHRKVLTHINITTWKDEEIILDPKIRTIKEELKKYFQNEEVYLVSNDKEEKIFIVRTYSDKQLGSFYLYSTITGKIRHIADRNPWLKPEEMCAMKPISYITRDGRTIEGYLTLPLGSVCKNLPTIVNPHGGPWSRDVWGFNPEVQFLANRGYAVFQMNFRGSTGYGKEHFTASFKQWGKTMQDDITDGVQWLIDQDISDPARIAIYGASYGGYATLAGMAYTPELYACGVDYVGVSNLFTFMNTIPPYWKPYLEMMYEMVGEPEKDIELMKAVSPVFHVDKIKAPLLIAQGAKDPRVNKKESDQMVEALKKRGIDVPYIVKENEGHGFANEENRFELYEMMEVFFHKHLSS